MLDSFFLFPKKAPPRIPRLPANPTHRWIIIWWWACIHLVQLGRIDTTQTPSCPPILLWLLPSQKRACVGNCRLLLTLWLEGETLETIGNVDIRGEAAVNGEAATLGFACNHWQKKPKLRALATNLTSYVVCLLVFCAVVFVWSGLSLLQPGQGKHWDLKSVRTSFFCPQHALLHPSTYLHIRRGTFGKQWNHDSGSVHASYAWPSR